ncbi:hypothetical protein JG687_00004577 [Phytophthora cactorum]|uniref:PWWP domain-containing protein n=1 Tax=Phytophthora cactorum TaxID=29920 RepID=A0A8T1UQU3_9STRA|nr:hypothetical protein JG687_00004577 [Phytophthora cactorum]
MTARRKRTKLAARNGSAVKPRVVLKEGDWLDVMDGDGVWNVARVLSVPSPEEVLYCVEITYDGWTEEYDEIITIRTPGTPEGIRNLAAEHRVYVDFFDSPNFAKRDRCWQKRRQVRTFEDNFDKKRTGSTGQEFEQALKLVLQSVASTKMPKFAFGALPLEYKFSPTESVEAVRRNMGDEEWFQRFAHNQMHHKQNHVYETLGDEEDDALSDDFAPPTVIKTGDDSEEEESMEIPDAKDEEDDASSDDSEPPTLKETQDDIEEEESMKIPKDSGVVIMEISDAKDSEVAVVSDQQTHPVHQDSSTNGDDKDDGSQPCQQFCEMQPDKEDVMDQDGVWNVARVLSVPSPEEVEVMYDGWPEEYDEVVRVDSDRVAPYHTFTWAVKCWVKYLNWPLWPSVITIRTPGTLDGIKNLSLENRLYVDFLEDPTFANRDRCWQKKRQVKILDSNFDKNRKQTNGAQFELALGSVLQSDATTKMPTFARGTLPLQYENSTTESVERMRKIMGNRLWYRNFDNNKERHMKTHKYETIGDEDEESSSDESVPKLKVRRPKTSPAHEEQDPSPQKKKKRPFPAKEQPAVVKVEQEPLARIGLGDMDSSDDQKSEGERNAALTKKRRLRAKRRSTVSPVARKEMPSKKGKRLSSPGDTNAASSMPRHVTVMMDEIIVDDDEDSGDDEVGRSFLSLSGQDSDDDMYFDGFDPDTTSEDKAATDNSDCQEESPTLFDEDMALDFQSDPKEAMGVTKAEAKSLPEVEIVASVNQRDEDTSIDDDDGEEKAQEVPRRFCVMQAGLEGTLDVEDDENAKPRNAKKTVISVPRKFDGVTKGAAYDFTNVLDDEGIWNTGVIVDVGKEADEDEDKVEVKYDGWGDEYNQWIDVATQRLAPLHTYTIVKKCWAKLTKWPWWPAFVVLRAPTTALAAHGLEEETKLYVEFYDSFNEEKRSRCWMQKKNVASFRDSFEERASKNIGKNFPKFVEGTQRAKAGTSPLLFSGPGTLPIEYSSKMAEPLEEKKKECTTEQWFHLYRDFSNRYQDLYGYSTAPEGSKSSSSPGLKSGKRAPGRPKKVVKQEQSEDEDESEEKEEEPEADEPEESGDEGEEAIARDSSNRSVVANHTEVEAPPSPNVAKEPASLQDIAMLSEVQAMEQCEPVAPAVKANRPANLEGAGGGSRRKDPPAKLSERVSAAKLSKTEGPAREQDPDFYQDWSGGSRYEVDNQPWNILGWITEGFKSRLQRK